MAPAKLVFAREIDPELRLDIGRQVLEVAFEDVERDAVDLGVVEEQRSEPIGLRRVGVAGAGLDVVNLVARVGLFDPLVDNDKIFAIIGPAFQTTIGCLIGILVGPFLKKEP